MSNPRSPVRSIIQSAVRSVISADQGGETSYFIDTYGQPTFAYSTRKLSSSAVNCLRVRRSSDNAELDIGFSGDSIDEAAISAFVGANDGFVTTWYDQGSSSNDAVEATTSSQPKIVSSGTIYKESGNVSLQSPATSDGMDTGVSGLEDKTVLFVANTTKPGSASAARLGTSSSGSGSVAPEFIHDFLDANGYRYFDGSTSVQLPLIDAAAGFNISYVNRRGSRIFLSANDSSEVNGIGETSANANSLKLFEEGGASSDELPTSITEVIAYSSDESSQGAAMIDDLNSQYGIFVGNASARTEIPDFGIPADGLIHHWTMDSITGSTLNPEVGSDSGVITGATQSAGRIDKSLSFIRTNGDLVNLGALGLTDATFSMWVKLDFIPAGATQYPLISNWNGGTSSAWLLDAYQGNIRWLTYTGSTLYSRTKASPAADTWFHVVAYSVDGVMDLYIDNVATGTTTSVANLRSTGNDVLLGKKGDSATELLNGSIDQVRIYNRVLTTEEIQALYDEGAPI